MNTVSLFKKHMKVEEKEWDNFFIVMPATKRCITANLTNAFKKMVLKNDLDFPLEIDLDIKNNDYFITEEEYENEDGITFTKPVIVIQNCRGMRKLELPQTTIDDLDK